MSLLKDLSEFAWPMAVVIGFCVFILTFRKDISGLFGRIKRLHWGDRGFDLGEARQQPSEVEGVEGLDKPTSADKSAGLSSPTLVRHKDSAMAIFDSPLLITVEEAIRNDPILSAETNPERREDALVRAYAWEKLRYFLEKIYHLIWGSQIEALEYLNQHGPSDKLDLEFTYSVAIGAESRPKDATFENWLNFLVQNNLIIVDNTEKYSITSLGQEFLRYIVTERYNKEKLG